MVFKVYKHNIFLRVLYKNPCPSGIVIINAGCIMNLTPLYINRLLFQPVLVLCSYFIDTVICSVKFSQNFN